MIGAELEIKAVGEAYAIAEADGGEAAWPSAPVGYSARMRPQELPDRKKVVHTDASLAENGAKCSFWKVAGMIGNRGISIAAALIPNFVGPGGLSIKHEPKRFEALYDIPIAITSKTAH